MENRNKIGLLEFSDDNFANSKRNKGRNSRRKGIAYENKIAELLRPIFPKVRRHLEFQKSEARGYDLANTGKYKIQIKKRINYSPVNTISEIKLDPGDVPILITSGENLPAMVVLPFDEFKFLLEALFNV